MNEAKTHIIVGGGAAGFFGAIACAQHHPCDRVIIVEKSAQVLSKVRISGGGRCNVTHACFDPAALITYYPRGAKELRGPFSRFQPLDTIAWFESRGVTLKTEEDGRMFPTTDDSGTIINCLQQEAKRLKVEVLLQHALQEIKIKGSGFDLHFANEKIVFCDRLLLTTGSAPKIHAMLAQLGHKIVPPVPSLFTFNIPDSPLLDLAGIAVDAVKVALPACGCQQNGPILLTHWGLSGPSVLKASAWAARELCDLNYKTELIVNWIPKYTPEELKQSILKHKQATSLRQISADPLFNLPKQLWKRLVTLAGFESTQKWSNLSHLQLQNLAQNLQATTLQIAGKTTYKQEFVTCGGIALDEVNFKTMSSRQIPNLFFAGEILNIDGVTGGFNFQNAWTTSWIAGQAMN